MSYPEDDSGNPLTVDAVARVGGELWAIDHMRLAYEPTVIPAGDEAVQMLRGPLKELADRYGCCLHVGVLPPRRRARIRPKIDAYYSDVLRRAEAAVISGEDWFDLDGFTSVQILKGGVRPDAEKVEVATWLGESASVEDQVVAALEGPLTAKLRGQLAAAKRADHRVMLLIDQVPDPTRRQPTVFLASWQTVKMVVDRVVTSLPGVVDCVWFRAGDGSFTNLTSPSTC
ncbi:MAG TPA: hypothetical protein VED84_00780 [Acidimicrobiales bacterium]|nr:hypothetical protein [Acidimicrobiales bacterium]